MAITTSFVFQKADAHCAKRRRSPLGRFRVLAVRLSHDFHNLRQVDFPPCVRSLSQRIDKVMQIHGAIKRRMTAFSGANCMRKAAIHLPDVVRCYLRHARLHMNKARGDFQFF